MGQRCFERCHLWSGQRCDTLLFRWVISEPLNLLRDYSGTLRSTLFRSLPFRSANVLLTNQQKRLEAPEFPDGGD